MKIRKCSHLQAHSHSSFSYAGCGWVCLCHLSDVLPDCFTWTQDSRKSNWANFFTQQDWLYFQIDLVLLMESAQGGVTLREPELAGSATFYLACWNCLIGSGCENEKLHSSANNSGGNHLQKQQWSTAVPPTQLKHFPDGFEFDWVKHFYWLKN